MASSVHCLFRDIRKELSMGHLFEDIREVSLSDVGDDSDKVSLHEDGTGESEKRAHNIFKNIFHL